MTNDNDFYKFAERVGGFLIDVSILGEKLGKLISEIEFPKFKYPQFDIDYESIEEIIINNSKAGWTITGEMGFGEYLNGDLLGQPISKLDQYFYSYYRDNEWENYIETKERILESIDSKWQGVIQECFDCFERDKYKVAIPTLISIIEGEISIVADTDNIGKTLLASFKEKVPSEEDKYEAMLMYSLYTFLNEELFRSRNFTYKRRKLLNRNWVLHGRDNPSHWQKVDALRLINVLSTIQFAKEVIRVLELDSSRQI